MKEEEKIYCGILIIWVLNEIKLNQFFITQFYHFLKLNDISGTLIYSIDRLPN